MTKCGRAAAPAAGVLACVIGLPAAAPAQSDGYSPPRTSAGHPDLQGIWGNNSVTPLERPDALAGRATLTEEELARVEATANALFAQDAGDAAFGDQFFNVAITEADSFTSSDGGTGNYNQFWLVEREFNNRTSLIVDPPSGKLPPATPAGETADRLAREGRGRPAAWTVDRGLSERCITFGLPNLLAGYNSYYQIFQTADHVVIEQELIHTTRIIPLDGRPPRRRRDSPVARRLARAVGRGHAGRRDPELLAPEQFPRRPRASAPGRTVHPGGAGRDALRVHGGRCDDVDRALDRARAVDPYRRADVRVRLPRREHRDGGHPGRRAGGRGGGRRAVTAAAGRGGVAGSPRRNAGLPRQARTNSPRGDHE